MNERQNVVAEALLVKRLRNLVPINDDTFIDPNYITHIEYQLFLDEERHRFRYFAPDHWTGNTFPKGKALEPIVGVRASDSIAFCEWLTRRDAQAKLGGWEFRLPTAGEFTSEGTHASSSQCNVGGYWACLDKGLFTFQRECPLDPLADDYCSTAIANANGRASTLVQSLGGALDYIYHVALRFTSERERTLAYTFGREPDYKFIRDNERVHLIPFHYLNQWRNGYYFSYYSRSPKLDRNSDLRERDREFADTFRPARSRAINQVLNRILNIDRFNILDHALDRDRDQSLNMDLGIQISMAESRVRRIERALTSYLDFGLAVDLTCALTVDMANLADIVRKKSNFSRENYMAELLNGYVDILALVMRIWGVVPAIEGIRVVKQRQGT